MTWPLRPPCTKTSRKRAVACAVGVLISLGCAGLGGEDPEPPPSTDPVVGIMNSLSAGQITRGQAQQYLWAAMLGTPGQIPDSVQVDSFNPAQGAAAQGDAHALMSQVFVDWEEYSGEEQWALALSMSRLTTNIPPLKLIQHHSAEVAQQQVNNIFIYGDEHSLAFCRYAEYGHEGKKIGFYDEFTAELPDCSGLIGTACFQQRTPDGQRVCEYSNYAYKDSAGSTVTINACHRRRFWESCDEGWLDPAFESKRQELLHAAPTPYQILQNKLGWPNGSPVIARLALLHSGGSSSSVNASTFIQPLDTIPYAIFQPDPVRNSSCGEKGLSTVLMHELFHVAHHYHHFFQDIESDESMAAWFEDFAVPLWDSEHGWFEQYACAPGLAMNDRNYNAALALRVLFQSHPDKPFDFIRSETPQAGLAGDRDLSRMVYDGLTRSERESLHTLSEQTYGMQINDLRNDTCDVEVSWAHGYESPGMVLIHAEVGIEPGETITYDVPEMSYAAVKMDVDERVLVLNLNLEQGEDTRTSVLVDAGGEAQERVIRLEPGMNQLCFEGVHGERDCSCSDVDEADLLPSHKLGIVSTQLDYRWVETVNITVDSIKHTDKATCWRVASASLYYDSLHMSETENGPIVYFLENPSGLPPDAPACTAIYMENHAGTVVDNLPSSPREAECTIHGKTSLPVEYRITSQSDASITGAYAPFGIHPLYMEDIEWECNLPNAQRYGMILQWQFNGLMTGQMPGIFRQIPGQYDPWDFPSYFEHTIQPGTDHMTLNRKRVSEDGIKVMWSVALEEVDQRECAFGEGLWQRSKDYHSEEYPGPR